MDPKKAIEELIEAGWTQVRIAERAGCAQATVSEIVTGRTKERGPSFRIASAILDLHREVCGQGAAPVPPAQETA